MHDTSVDGFHSSPGCTQYYTNITIQRPLPRQSAQRHRTQTFEEATKVWQIRESSERVQRKLSIGPQALCGSKRRRVRDTGEENGGEGQKKVAGSSFHAATPRPSFHATMVSVPRQRLNTQNIAENPTIPSDEHCHTNRKSRRVQRSG